MYVCVCNALNEDQFRTVAVEHPNATAEEAFAIMGRAPDCGSCLSFADSVMAEARKHHNVPPNASIA